MDSILLTIQQTVKLKIMDPEPPVSIAPYAVLEIERGATPAEVRTAYKKLALRYHPGSYSSIVFHYLPHENI